MSIITVDLLLAVGVSRIKAVIYAPQLQAAADEFHIATPLRIAHWLAQIMQESGLLQYTKELWGPTKAQMGYEGRKDLGNTVRGDGRFYAGVGIIQTTGRYNIERALKKLGFPPGRPDLLTSTIGSCRAAGLFWQDHNLNRVADASGSLVSEVTRAVNGGLTHLHERQGHFNRIMTHMAKTMLPK